MGDASDQQSIDVGIEAYTMTNEDLWSMINLDDDAATELWAQHEAWLAGGTTATNISDSSSPICCDEERRIFASSAAGREGDGDEPTTTATADATPAAAAAATAKQKRAKRQAQNRIAQQAFRARKEKLVRSLSTELATLQRHHATTRAANETLTGELALARTELAAIRSVVQQLRRPTAAATAESGVLTLKIDVESLLQQKRRQAMGAGGGDHLATPPISEDGGGGGGEVDFEAWCDGEAARY